VLTMLSLGAFYFIQQAPFLGAVQIIVYTGAIMILFLFVLMLSAATTPTRSWRPCAVNGWPRSCSASALPVSSAA